MTRPTVAPELLAAFVAAAPSRVSRRLDAEPRVAESWGWSASNEGFVVDAGEVTVSLKPAVLASSDVSCTCLLAPRCLHVLAVLAVLPLAETTGPTLEASPHGEARDVAVDVPSSGARVEERTSPEVVDDGVDPVMRDAAANVWRVVRDVLHAGLAQTGMIRLGELLRVAHTCRLVGLPRLESAVLGVFEAARDLRERRPSFRAIDACARLAEALHLAHRLSRGDALAVGTARRRYAPVMGLRLAGLVSAPIVRRGYAGVVTYFTDGARVYSVQELAPGETGRARDAQGATLRFGEISLTHREAARSGLLFSRAEVSSDGRLGAGKSVVCVGITRDETLVDRVFDTPLDVQLELADRGERAGLIFVEGGVARSDAAFAITRDDGGAIPLRPAIDDLRFHARDNLVRLAEAGSRLRLVARLADDGAALEPLAFRFEGEDTWRSVDDEALGRADVPRGEPRVWNPIGAIDVLAPARMRAVRFALAGARSLPGSALAEVSREASRLRDRLLPTAADALLALAVSREDAAAAWLALHVYLESAQKSLLRETW